MPPGLLGWGRYKAGQGGSKNREVHVGDAILPGKDPGPAADRGQPPWHPHKMAAPEGGGAAVMAAGRTWPPPPALLSLIHI